MPELRLPTGSNPQEFREQGDERLINCYAEQIDKKRFRVRMIPGLTSFSAGASDVNGRGAIEVGGTLYAVFESGFYSVASDGTRTLIGYITAAGPVFMAANARGEIGILTDTSRYFVYNTTTGTLRNITINDLTSDASATAVGLVWLSGYFFIAFSNGQVFNTGLDDAESINGLDFFTAEGNPDGNVGIATLGLELWVFGTQSTEVWGLDPSPPATGSPMVRLGGAVINRGAISGRAIVPLDNTLFWIGEDDIVYRNTNYNPQRVSNFGVERAIRGAANRETIRGTTYSQDGHVFYVITDDNFTWVYDANTQRWHERKSINLDRSDVTIYIRAFAKVLAMRRGDGVIYEVSADVRTEGSDEIVSLLRFPDLPQDIPVDLVEVDFVTGRAPISGASNATAPVTTLRWSDDGGATWKGNRQLSLGAIGEYQKRVRTTRLGTTGQKWGRRFELQTSDPHIVSVSRFNVESA